MWCQGRGGKQGCPPGCVAGGGFCHGWGCLLFLKSGICFSWIPAFAGMTVGVGSASGTPLHRHPLSLTRGSRAIIPYFGGALRGRKSGNNVAWMLAFASMTIEVEPASGTPLYRHPLSLARGSRAKIPYFGGVSRGGKAVLVFLDARMRKHDGRGWVSVRDSSPPSPSKLGPRVRDKETLFIMEPARDDLNFIFNHTINKPVF